MPVQLCIPQIVARDWSRVPVMGGCNIYRGTGLFRCSQRSSIVCYLMHVWIPCHSCSIVQASASHCSVHAKQLPSEVIKP